MSSNELPEIPVFRPDIGEAEIAAVTATLRSGWIGAGPRAAEFERRFAAYVGVPHAIATASGTAALQAALAGLGVGPGDEIILPSFTWVSAFQAIRACGATPVFADIEPNYLTIDAGDVAALVTAHTRGIIAIHHGGQLADLGALAAVARAHGLWLLDDAAHACGAMLGARKVGALTDVTCFSFNAMKNLAVGDGGMVTTSDDELAARIRIYRSLGIDRDTFARYGLAQTQARWVYDVVADGLRLHMNDIAAAIGLVQLERLDQLNAQRAHLVARYHQSVSSLPGVRAIRARPGTQASHHMFTLCTPARDRFIELMQTRRISIGMHYIPVHQFSIAQPFHRSLPVTEKIWREVATLPLYPSMTVAEQARVIAAVHAVQREL